MHVLGRAPLSEQDSGNSASQLLPIVGIFVTL